MAGEWEMRGEVAHPSVLLSARGCQCGFSGLVVTGGGMLRTGIGLMVRLVALKLLMACWVSMPLAGLARSIRAAIRVDCMVVSVLWGKERGEASWWTGAMRSTCSSC